MVCATARSAAIESRFPARSALVAVVVCVVALLATAVVPSARADVVRLSRQQALAALARPVPRALPGMAARVRAGAPTVTAGTASAVTAASATVGGTVNPNGRRTTYHFDYGTATAYGSLAPSPDAVAGSDRTAHAISVSLTGLLPATTYGTSRP
jgi:hypothetical protein